jgi:hypothetical protein
VRSQLNARTLDINKHYGMSDPYAALNVQPRSGSEQFHVDGTPAGFDLISFWRWSASDLVSNVWRGVLAEYLVTQAVGPVAGVRTEWDVCDLRTEHGARIEVKSAAYLQSWQQKSLSSIGFDIAMKRGWDAATNTYASSICRGADLYVFALLAHRDKGTLDPLDLAQWMFYVVPVTVLNTSFGSQKRISLSALHRVAPSSDSFYQLKAAVRRERAHPRDDV